MYNMISLTFGNGEKMPQFKGKKKFCYQPRVCLRGFQMKANFNRFRPNKKRSTDMTGIILRTDTRDETKDQHSNI